MWACASGSTETVQVLLEEGEANVNIKVSFRLNTLCKVFLKSLYDPMRTCDSHRV